MLGRVLLRSLGNRMHFLRRREAWCFYRSKHVRPLPSRQLLRGDRTFYCYGNMRSGILLGDFGNRVHALCSGEAYHFFWGERMHFLLSRQLLRHDDGTT